MGLLVKKRQGLFCSQMACGYSLTVLCNKMGGIHTGTDPAREKITWWVIRNKGRESERAERTRKWRRAEGGREKNVQSYGGVPGCISVT